MEAGAPPAVTRIYVATPSGPWLASQAQILGRRVKVAGKRQWLTLGRDAFTNPGEAATASAAMLDRKIEATRRKLRRLEGMKPCVQWDGSRSSS